MASLQDYLSSQNADIDARLEGLVKGLGQYQRNTQVLQSLGQEDKTKKDKNFLSKALNILGAPGRIVTGGVLEAIGRPTRELQRTSGLEQIKKLATGDIQVSGRDLPGLQSNKNDTFTTKMLKGLGGFAADVALDPLSYVGAPSSLARTKVAENLLSFVKNADFLDDIVSRSSKGIALVEEYLAKSPKAKRAVAAGKTAIDDLGEAGIKTAAAEQLANDLSTTFLTRGRSGLVKKLEDITGSRAQAVAVFKKLPEEVKGGLVLQLPTGKQIGRLTSGTGAMLGPIAPAVNTARQALGVAANPLTRSFAGKAGGILADVKSAEWAKRGGKELTQDLSRATLLDYTQFKKGLAARGIAMNQIGGQIVSAQAGIQGRKAAFSGSDLDDFEVAFRDHFFTPNRAVDNVDSEAYMAGVEAAKDARVAYNDLYQTLKSEGIDVKNIGDPFEYSSLMLKDDAYEEMRKLGIVDSRGNVYRMENGRRSGIEANLDDDLKATTGWEDPENPGVRYLHPKAINDKLEQSAIAAGKTADEAKKARIYIEDPALIIARYGEYVKNASATRRFIKTLEETGTLVKDIPEARKLLNEWTSSTMAAGVKGLMPEVRQFMERRAATARARINELTSVEPLEEQQRKLAAATQQIRNQYDMSRVRVSELRAQVLKASEEVATAAPNINRLRAQLSGFAQTSREIAVGVEAGERAMKNVNARLRTAEKNLEKAGGEIEQIKALREEAVNSGDNAAVESYDTIITRLGDDAADAQEKLARETAIKEQNAVELNDIRAMRNQSRQQGAEEAERQIIAYEQAVSRRNALTEELSGAIAARDGAAAAARRVDRTIGLQTVNNLEGLVMSYVDSARKVAEYKLANPIKPSMTQAERQTIKDEITRLEKAVSMEKRVLKEVLDTGKGEFKDVAGDYAEQVMEAAEKLTDEQFKAYMVLSNEQKINELMTVVASGQREDAEVMQAISDIYTAFKQVRDVIPANMFNKLADVQRKLLDESNFASLRDKLIREETQPGAIAREVVGQGMEAVQGVRGATNMYATRSIIDAMESMYKVNDNPSAWQKIIDDYIDPFLAMWKVATTSGRGPGFVINNLVGGMYNNHIGGVSTKYAAHTFTTMMEMRNAVVKLEKMYPTKSFFEINRMAEDMIASRLNRTRVGDKGMGELFKAFSELGGTESTDIAVAIQRSLKSGQDVGMEAFGRKAPTSFVYQSQPSGRVEELFRGGINKLTSWRGQRWMNDMSQSSEVFVRFQAFMDGYAKYGNVDAAMNNVYALHFNYKDLGAGEEWLRRIVPFYTWARNNVPLQLRTLVLQPGKIQKFMYAQENLRKTLGEEGEDSWMNQVMPEWLAKNAGFITMIDSGTGNLAISNKLPFGDINQYLSWEGRLPELDPMGLISGIGPGLRVPLEAATGRSLATGAPREDGVALSLLKDVLPQVGIIQRGATAAEQLLPGPNIAGTKEDKALSETLSLLGIPGLFGLQVQTVGPRQITGELYRRADTQDQQIQDAAASLGVDLEWVRKRLSKGVPPEVLASMIQAGAGRIQQTGIPEQSEMTQRTRNKTLNILRGLQSP